MGYLRRVIADSRPPSSGTPRVAAMLPAFQGHFGADGLAEAPAGESAPHDKPSGPADRRPVAAAPGHRVPPGAVEEIPQHGPPSPDQGARPPAARAPAGFLPDAPPPPLQSSPPRAARATAPEAAPRVPSAAATRDSSPLPSVVEPPLPGNDSRAAMLPAASEPVTGARKTAPGQAVTASTAHPVIPVDGRSEGIGAEPPPAAAASLLSEPSPLLAAAPPSDLPPAATPLSAGALDTPTSSAPPATTAQMPAPSAQKGPAAAYGVTSRQDDPAPRPVRVERAVSEAPPEVRIGRVEVFVDGPPAGAAAAPSAPPRDNTSRYRLRSL